MARVLVSRVLIASMAGQGNSLWITTDSRTCAPGTLLRLNGELAGVASYKIPVDCR